MVLWHSQEYLYESECKEFGSPTLHFESLLIKPHRNQKEEMQNAGDKRILCISPGK